MMLQEAKPGKHEAVKKAVRDVGGQRNSLKVQVTTCLKKLSEVQSEMQ